MPFEPVVAPYIANDSNNAPAGVFDGIQLTSKAQIEDWIVHRAMAYDLPVDKVLATAQCESNLIPDAKSKTSSATGIFQFIIGTWEWTMSDMGLPKDLDRTNPEINIEAAMFLMKNSGIHHWDESKACSDRLIGKH